MPESERKGILIASVWGTVKCEVPDGDGWEAAVEQALVAALERWRNPHQHVTSPTEVDHARD